MNKIFYEMQNAIRAAHSRTGDTTLSIAVDSGKSCVVRVIPNGLRRAPIIIKLTGMLEHGEAIDFLNAYEVEA